MVKRIKEVKQWFDTDLEVAVLAIVVIAFLETIALIKGMNGAMFGASMVALGGIIGWVCKTHRDRIKKK